jgi:hypothetical protein
MDCNVDQFVVTPSLERLYIKNCTTLIASDNNILRELEGCFGSVSKNFPKLEFLNSNVTDMNMPKLKFVHLRFKYETRIFPAKIKVCGYTNRHKRSKNMLDNSCSNYVKDVSYMKTTDTSNKFICYKFAEIIRRY